MKSLGRQLRLFDRRILVAAFLVALAVLVVGGVADHRSCNRAIKIDSAHNASTSASAVARLESALAENEPQRTIDVRAARDLLLAQVRLPICARLVPGI